MNNVISTESVSFTYKSIGNFIKLLATIQFEKNNTPEDISIWHERFADECGDNLFESFLVELFPEGKTIEVEDVETVVNHAKKFLEKDEQAQNIRNRNIKIKFPYWVYFKIDNVVYPCGYAKHTQTVTNICVNFFKGFEDIDIDYLKKFILENFEIQSDNTDIQKIANDSAYICRRIIFNTIESEEE